MGRRQACASYKLQASLVLEFLLDLQGPRLLVDFAQLQVQVLVLPLDLLLVVVVNFCSLILLGLPVVETLLGGTCTPFVRPNNLLSGLGGLLELC